MSLNGQYDVNVSTPQAGRQVVAQVIPGLPLYTGTAGAFVLAVMGLTSAGGSQRWYFSVWGPVGSPYNPEVRFLQVDPDPSDPVGAYAMQDATGNPDPQLGTGSVGEWP